MNSLLVSVVVVTRNRNKELSLCLQSIFKQSHIPEEVVVVDNGSGKNVQNFLNKKFSKVKFVRSEINLGGAGGRNLGLLHTRGKFILFMDDDATADVDMVKELLKVIKLNQKTGIVQPKIYEKEHPDVIQGVGHGINLRSGRVYGIGVHEKDMGQFEKIMEIPMAGCTWMVRREVFDEIGDYDEEIFIPYEDSDFSVRARKAKYKILYVPKAMVWHVGAKKTFVHPWLEWLGITSAERSFRISRNKIIFMKKHAKNTDFLIFLIFFEPVYLVLHSLIIVMTSRFDILLNYWRGVISGVDYCLLPLKLYLFSFVDPVSRIIDTSGRSILDVACGRGLPMMVLKKRTKFKHSTGVDLFEPYINECKGKRIHDSYVVSDVRTLPFKNKSFDIVMALQVLEHLKKAEALMVLDNLEKIARKQVIVSMPIGKTFHPAVDGNKLQLHKSGFVPAELSEKGYKVIKMGRREIEGIGGLIDKYQNGIWKKMIYLLILLLNWALYFVQPFANYYMVAYKKVN